MVNLRIQELAEAKGISLEELSQVSSVSIESMYAYANSSVEITEETSADLKKISNNLKVPVIELVKPADKKQAFKFKIQEIAEKKGITLEELSKCSGVHLAVLAFYSTQSISQQKLDEEQCKITMNNISKALECSIDDLKVESELPITQLRLEAFAEEKGLSLEELRVISNLPKEFMDLINTQPINLSVSIKINHTLRFPIRCACCRSPFGCPDNSGCDCETINKLILQL